MLRRMDVRKSVAQGIASQLGHPQGAAGRVVGRLLNRGNRGTVTAAVGALAPRAGATVSDIGFGGGLGLRLLLDRVGRAGHVHGIDISTDMVTAAARRFADDTIAGRLLLHEAPIERLPLPDEALAGALTLNTLYFVDDLGAALAGCARVLAPAGRLVVGIGDPEAMAAMPITRHGFRLRPVAEVREALADVGLPVREHRRAGSGARAAHLLVADKSP